MCYADFQSAMWLFDLFRQKMWILLGRYPRKMVEAKIVDLGGIKHGVIGKALTTFFNCHTFWPRLTCHFSLMSPGTDETFLSIHRQEISWMHICSGVYAHIWEIVAILAAVSHLSVLSLQIFFCDISKTTADKAYPLLTQGRT